MSCANHVARRSFRDLRRAIARGEMTFSRDANRLFTRRPIFFFTPRKKNHDRQLCFLVAETRASVSLARARRDAEPDVFASATDDTRVSLDADPSSRPPRASEPPAGPARRPSRSRELAEKHTPLRGPTPSRARRAAGMPRLAVFAASLAALALALAPADVAALSVGDIIKPIVRRARGRAESPSGASCRCFSSPA
jgi:hypothetical protein